jgi:hypothetical protein
LAQEVRLLLLASWVVIVRGTVSHGPGSRQQIGLRLLIPDAAEE